MAFTSLESIAVEGDGVVTICLAVISGEITTPTNINLTTFPGLLIDSPPDTEINIALASGELVINLITIYCMYYIYYSCKAPGLFQLP